MTTIISKGTHYVGESVSSNVGVSSRGKQGAFRKQDEWVFENEDHLEDTLAGYKREEAQAQRERAQFRAYLYANAARRREQNNYHESRPDFDPCPSCGICRCGRGRLNSFRCLCAEGKKQIGSDRFAFLNNSVKAEYLTTTWRVGVGVVPKENQSSRSPLEARGL